jgi:hypothetical protein
VAGHFWDYLRSPACAHLHDTFVCSNHLERQLRAFLAATNLPPTSWRAIAIELGAIAEKRREWFKLSKRPGGQAKARGACALLRAGAGREHAHELTYTIALPANTTG